MIDISEIKVGDIIVVEDPEGNSYEPGWNSAMNDLIGIEYEVEEVDSYFYSHSVAIIDDYGSRWLIDLDYAHFATDPEIVFQELNMNELF